MKKILVVLTNHPTIGTTDDANGTYAPELTHALHVLTDAGYGYDLASIKGGKVPIYGTDIEGDAVNAEMLADADFQQLLNNTMPVEAVNGSDYAAIYYPGGFGLLSDLAVDERFAKISADHYESGGVLAAVCHGPAGFLPITLSNGEKLLADKTVTAFTREEEIDFETIDKIPYLLEESLARMCAEYRKVQPWQEFVIEDNRVISGQNPASAAAVGRAIVKLLAS